MLENSPNVVATDERHPQIRLLANALINLLLLLVLAAFSFLTGGWPGLSGSCGRTKSMPRLICCPRGAEVRPALRRRRRIWSSHLLFSSNLNPLPGHPKKDPFTGMDRRQSWRNTPEHFVRFRAVTKSDCDGRVSETRRIRDVPFEEPFDGRFKG